MWETDAARPRNPLGASPPPPKPVRKVKAGNQASQKFLPLLSFLSNQNSPQRASHITQPRPSAPPTEHPWSGESKGHMGRKNDSKQSHLIFFLLL